MAVTLARRSPRRDPRARRRDVSERMLRRADRPRRRSSPSRSRCPTRPKKVRGAAFSCGRPTTAPPKRAPPKPAASCSGSITRIPDHPAQPSQYDLDHAWPFFSYVIVSVRDGEPRELRSWRLRDDRSQFDEEPVNSERERRTLRVNHARKIHIPTPLRPFTDKLDVVELDGATVSELLANLTTRFAGLKQHLFNDEGRAAQLRQRLRQRRRHPLPAEGSDAAQGRRHGQHHPVGGRGTGRAEPLRAPQRRRLARELPQLSADEVRRYSRHLILPEVGMDGQRALKAAKVLCIGAGGLGSPAAMYLAAAGVGTLGIVDFDVVDISNLQRQLLHGTSDVGRPKLDSAKDRLHALNPNVHVETYETALSSENALQLFEPYDVILDGTDNFPTRYLVNDACVLLGKPNAYGSIFRFEGQASVFGDQGWPVLSLPLSRAAAARARAELRRRRRARRAARHHRHDSGDRDHQADSRQRRAADRPLPDLRRAADEVPRAEAAQGRGLPGLRHASDRHRADRLRAVLRRRRRERRVTA